MVRTVGHWQGPRERPSRAKTIASPARHN
jgi:hypothetical protein